MKKFIKSLIITFCIVFSILILSVLFIGQYQNSFTKNSFTQNDYSFIMEENIKSNPRVVDIAMLGAHDAFSNKINKKSLVDPQEDEDSILNNYVTKMIGEGLFVRSAKAQKSTTTDLLSRGVRYLDVRITFYEGSWYATHGFLSGHLEDYLMETIEFLIRTNKEVIVFDIQHAYTGNLTMTDLFDYISIIEFDDRTLFDFVDYDINTINLGDLRYEDVTKSGSGVVVLAKAEVEEDSYHYEYEKSIRSTWHNKNNIDEMIVGINNELQTLKENKDLDRDKFRVNQAQMTVTTSPEQIVDTIKGWSLLDMGEDFNSYILLNEDVSSWLTEMPILMTDYSDSMKGNFNEGIIEIINKFNNNL